MTSEASGSDDSWIGGRIALTAWIVLSVAVYLLGMLVPWDRFWLGLGVMFAPVYAGQFLLPVVFTFSMLESILAIIASLIYLAIFFSIVVSTGWWREPATGAVAAWPVFLPLGSAILAAIAFAPIYALAAIWDLPLEWPKRVVEPRRTASLLKEPSQPTKSVPEFSRAMRQERSGPHFSKKVVAVIGLVASILTIIGFLLQFVF